MNILLLNWTGGNNDPFTFGMTALKHELQLQGKQVTIVDIEDPKWRSEVVELMQEGVEYAISNQGLASNFKVQAENEGETNLWDFLKVPLICIHADHPCHNPVYHLSDSRYCAHLYVDRDFARYSNKHFRRRYGAITIQTPTIFDEAPEDKFQGDHFVLMRNMQPTAQRMANWESFGPHLSAPLALTAQQINDELGDRNSIDIHAILDERLIALGVAEKLVNSVAFHCLHAEIDMYYRNYKTEMLIKKLSDFPIHIHGAGWSDIPQSKAHKFLPGRNAADSKPLYYSNYGILDISPSTFLHDRTIRAIHNNTSFLTDSQVPRVFSSSSNERSDMFYHVADDSLCNRLEAIVQNPKAHRESCRHFSALYKRQYTAESYIDRLDLLARAMRG